MKIDIAYFPSVEGSMTSKDDLAFMLHVSFLLPDEMPGHIGSAMRKLPH